jgi:DNA-directed RNA polymerase subunit L
MPEIKRKPMKLTKEDGEVLTVFDEHHTLGDIVRWIMENRSDAEDVYCLLKEALGK